MRHLSLTTLALALLLVGCATPDGDAIAEEKLATTEQQIVVCSSECAPPTYNGSPVACASNTYCYSDAAGAYCLNNNGTWSSALCALAPNPCGNGVCDSGETASSCPQDCGSVCGNGVCESGETRFNCSVDCDVCGDGICRPTERTWCSEDCGILP
jgi:hypothetical protein